MGKKDFDIEFDFDEEFNFDPKSFLGTEDYDKNIDLNTFSDDELGLTAGLMQRKRMTLPIPKILIWMRK